MARSDRLNHFRVNADNMDKVVTFVLGLMDRDYATYDDVPYHSRWRHFEVGGVDRAKALRDTWDTEGATFPADSWYGQSRIIRTVSTAVTEPVQVHGYEYNRTVV